MAELFVNIRSHHYVCYPKTAMAREMCVAFAKRFVQYGIGRKVRGVFIREPLKAYAAKTADNVEMRFHRNTLQEFKAHVERQRCGPNFVEWIEDPLPPAVEVELKPRAYKLGTEERLELREDENNAQISAVEYFTEGTAPTTKLVGVQTGKGKGIISMFALSRVGLRVFVCVLPQYVTKWCDELIEVLELERSDIMVVRSGKDLMALTQLCMEGLLQCKVVVLASTIYRGWIKVYEQLREGTLDLGYAFLPDQLMEGTGCGVKVVDEVHREFHNFFKIMLYTHCQHDWGMSATLRSKDPFMMRMYEIAYPSNERFKGLPYDKYVNYTAWMYRFDHPEKISCTERGRTEYSHNVFEQSIIKQKGVLANYLAMINIISQGLYFKKYLPGDRFIIFAASVDMCHIIAEYMKELYPHLDVRSYVEGEPKENLYDSDIRVTTIGGGGTGHDIKRLTGALMTTAIDSEAANLQAMGRLRKLHDGRTPEFAYLVNQDNEKHMKYHESKVQLLDGVALHLMVTPYHPLL
jgi:superfamily II DNA or RNA helicase